MSAIPLLVLLVPNIVGNELVKGLLPGFLEVVVVDVLDCVHQAVDVLNQNIITSDQDLLLVLRTRWVLGLQVLLAHLLGG